MRKAGLANIAVFKQVWFGDDAYVVHRPKSLDIYPFQARVECSLTGTRGGLIIIIRRCTYFSVDVRKKVLSILGGVLLASRTHY